MLCLERKEKMEKVKRNVFLGFTHRSVAERESEVCETVHLCRSVIIYDLEIEKPLSFSPYNLINP